MKLHKFSKNCGNVLKPIFFLLSLINFFNLSIIYLYLWTMFCYFFTFISFNFVIFFNDFVNYLLIKYQKFLNLTKKISMLVRKEIINLLFKITYPLLTKNKYFCLFFKFLLIIFFKFNFLWLKFFHICNNSLFNSLCCEKRESNNKNHDINTFKKSPKATEEIRDQQTKGYNDLQKHSINEIVPNEKFSISEGIFQDEDSLRLHNEFKNTEKTPEELQDDLKEAAKFTFKQTAYAATGVVTSKVAGKSGISLAKGAATTAAGYNTYDHFIEKGEGFIDKQFSKSSPNESKHKK